MTATKRLIEQLKRHEGVRLKPYRCTAGKLTIGVGRNLDDVGISMGEAEMMLVNDIESATSTAAYLVGEEFVNLNEARRAVVVNMAFNMGLPVLSKFKNTLAMIRRHDYEAAARGMLNSKWARQVGQRAKELSEQMRTGEWQHG